MAKAQSVKDKQTPYSVYSKLRPRVRTLGFPGVYCTFVVHNRPCGTLADWPGFLTSTQTLDRSTTDDEVFTLTRRLGRMPGKSPAIDMLVRNLFSYPAPKAAAPSVRGLCDVYVGLVKNLSIARQIFLTETDDQTTIFTIIDAPPFEDKLRQPIYEAQLQLLRMSADDVRLGFDVSNVQELKDAGNITRIVPEGAQLLWQR